MCKPILFEQDFVFTEDFVVYHLSDVRFELIKYLNHSGGDIVKTITVTSEDKDGDIVTSASGTDDFRRSAGN
ncbi:hypothetical protein OH492_09210 [Vibrio chagasii]|nr:hypothetical protein [Vibrio chagasii]